jgi:hypothetical protein
MERTFRDNICFWVLSGKAAMILYYHGKLPDNTDFGVLSGKIFRDNICFWVLSGKVT